MGFREIVLCVAVAWAAVPLHAAFTEADRVLFNQAPRPPQPTANEAWWAADRRAGELGREESIEALDAILASGHPHLLKTFVERFRMDGMPRNAGKGREFELRVLRFYDDKPTAILLMQGLRTVENPELFERIHSDAQELARLRAERRERCTAVIVYLLRPTATPPPPNELRDSPAFRRQLGVLSGTSRLMLTWRYVCRGMGDDDPATDDDGLARREDSAIRRGTKAWEPRRDLAALGAASRVEVPGGAQRLAALLRDLSLLPPDDWKAVGGKPADTSFRRVVPPADWLLYLAAHSASPGRSTILEMLASAEADKAWYLQHYEGRDTFVPPLLQMLLSEGRREDTMLLARWIGIASDVSPREARNRKLEGLISLLGAVLPEAQVDISSIRTAVMHKLPSGEDAAGIRKRFDLAELENRQVREPTGAALSYWAAREPSRPDVVAFLLAKGADPNSVPPEVTPALIVDARRDGAYAQMLLKSAAKANIRGPKGITVLQAVCVREPLRPENPDLASLLIAHGADVNAVNDAKETPLHLAVSSPETMKRLIAAGAKLETEDAEGNAALARAMHRGTPQTVKILLAAGADPNHQNHAKESPYDTLSRGQSTELAVLLEKHGGRVSVAERMRRARNIIGGIVGLLLGGGH